MFGLIKKVLSSPGKPLREKEALGRGNAFLAKGELERAAECYTQAVSINPGYAEGHLNLGYVSREQKSYADARRHLERAIQLDPGMEDAYYILGTVAVQLGNLGGAIEKFRQALELKPDFKVVYDDLSLALIRSGDVDGARRLIEKGLALDPDFAELHCYAGNLLFQERRFDEAIACYRQALRSRPDYVLVHSNMAKVCIEQAKLEEATAWFRKVEALDPDSVQTASFLLIIQTFDGIHSPADYLAEARRYGAKVAAQARPYSSWSVRPAGGRGRPLRVGLVSGDFRNHPVGFFLENILGYLDPTRVELVAYPTQAYEDELTARIKPRFAAWNAIGGLDNEAAARRIHDDGIHVLVDLAGHTADNRLPLFAWMAAPVQVSWLGYFATTGVPGMDYFLADPVSVPEHHRGHFTETVWYLPDTRLCFTPPAPGASPACTPPPAVRNGYITFGCFQYAGKVTDTVLTAWARILRSLPQARLRLQNNQMNYPNEREQLQRRLERAGIALERVTMVGAMPRMDYLAAHAQVDIILDTFPYTGGTTTCEALWMGVPTLTLAGETLLARQGASLLTCAGLEDWVAEDEDDYVRRAVARAADLDGLAQLRSGLRQKVLACPLFDGTRFARHLEDALEGMWRQKMGPRSDHE